MSRAREYNHPIGKELAACFYLFIKNRDKERHGHLTEETGHIAVNSPDSSGGTVGTDKKKIKSPSSIYSSFSDGTHRVNAVI